MANINGYRRNKIQQLEIKCKNLTREVESYKAIALKLGDYTQQIADLNQQIRLMRNREQAFFNAISDAVLVVDLNRKILHYNRTAQEIFPIDELASSDHPLKCSSVVRCNNCFPEMCIIQKFKSSDLNVIEFETEVTRKSGHKFPAIVSASPVYNSSNQMERVVISFKDITEQKRTERELRKYKESLEKQVEERTAELTEANKQLQREISKRKHSEERLQNSKNFIETVFNNLNDSISTIDAANFKIVGANRAFLNRVNMEEKQVIGKHCYEVNHNRCKPCPPDNCTLVKIQTTGYDSLVEQIYYDKDGTERYLEVSTTPIKNQKGEIYQVINIARDITERKLAEEALAKERNLLRTVIDNLPDYIYVKDTKSRYSVSNIAHMRFLGATMPDEVVGKTVFELFSQDLAAQYYADDQEIIRSGQPLLNREECCIDQTGNSVWNLTTKVPLRDSKGTIVGIVGIARDITERKQTEEKLQTYAAKLERSNRELQDFTYVASHDLQEPLRKVQAFGDRLKAKCGDALSDQGRDYLERMQNAAARMHTLINDLLTYSRVTTKARPFTPIDLSEITREVLSDLEVRIEEVNARIELGDLPTIDADPLQMRQLLQNLIGNALKFHRKEEPPIVKIQAKLLNDYKQRLVTYPPGNGFCQITIEDNGIGFDEKYADRIFGVFQRLHGRSQYEGTGLGLAVCRKIVERHGGSIEAKSKPGEGATFIVTLPVKPFIKHIS